MSTHSDILRVKQQRFFKKERLFKTLLKVSERHSSVCESFEACKKQVQEEARNQTGSVSQQQAIALAREGYNRVSEENRIATNNWMKAREAYYAADTAARCYETFMEAEKDLAEMRKILKRRVTQFNEEGNITQEEVDLARQVHRYAVDLSIEAEENWTEAQKHADTFSSEDDENLQQIATGFFDAVNFALIEEAVDMPSIGLVEEAARSLPVEAVHQIDVAQTLSGNKRQSEEEEPERQVRHCAVRDPRGVIPNPPRPVNIQPVQQADRSFNSDMLIGSIVLGIIVDSVVDAVPRVATAVVNEIFSPRQILAAVSCVVGAMYNAWGQ